VSRHQRYRRRIGERTCCCDGYLFIHRRGSLHCRNGGRLGSMSYLDALREPDAHEIKKAEQEDYYFRRKASSMRCTRESV
jgi:hypothetical protein